MMSSHEHGQIFLTTKFGNHVTPEGGREIRNDPEYIRQSVNESLKKLKTDYIDLLYWYGMFLRLDQIILLADLLILALQPSIQRSDTS
jgi:aryl-alcohol dehydrogenase-like predicted oxidoreductase